MSREAWGDSPELEPHFCPLCGGVGQHTDDCELGAMQVRALAAEAEVARLKAGRGAPKASSPEASADERSRFHAWLQSLGAAEKGITLQRLGEEYIDARTRSAWQAWQARAALSTPPAAVGVPVAWRVRGYAQFKTGNPGPWRYFDGPTKLAVNTPECCDMEPLYATPQLPVLSDEQRLHIDQAQQYLEDYADEADRGGTNSVAEGARASAHVLRAVLAAAVKPRP